MTRGDKRRAVMARIGSRIGWRLGVGWYRITQELSEDDSPPVKTAESYEEILERLAFGNRYAPDPINGKLDIMRHPRRIQRWIDTGKPIGDCDEHAAYWLACLLRSGLAADVSLGIIQAQDLATGKLWGHALALWTEHEGGPTLWADYATPEATVGEWGWVERVAAKYGSRPLFAGIAHVRCLLPDDTLAFGAKRGKAYR